MASVFSVPVGNVPEHSSLGTWSLTLSTQDWAPGAFTSPDLNPSGVSERGEEMEDTKDGRYREVQKASYPSFLFRKKPRTIFGEVWVQLYWKPGGWPRGP